MGRRGRRPASKRMQDLLAKYSGHSAAQQVEFIQQTFDATTAQLDRRGEAAKWPTASGRSPLRFPSSPRTCKNLEAERQAADRPGNVKPSRLAGDEGVSRIR